MAPSGFGPHHGMWLEDAQTKCIDVIPTPWVMTHALGLVSFHPQHQQLAPLYRAKKITGWECAPRDVWARLHITVFSKEYFFTDLQ